MTKTPHPRIIQERELPGYVFNALVRSGEIPVHHLTIKPKRGREHHVPLLVADDVRQLMKDERRLSRIRNLGDVGRSTIQRLLDEE